MNEELQETLFNKYPEIFQEKDLPMTQTAMCWGIDTGDGWYDIIDTICSKLDKLNADLPEGKKIIARQVKEKFGGLRFYTSRSSDESSEIIREGEAKSYDTCDMCGNPGYVNPTGYWMVTLCESCHEARIKRMEALGKDQ